MIALPAAAAAGFERSKNAARQESALAIPSALTEAKAEKSTDHRYGIARQPRALLACGVHPRR